MNQRIGRRKSRTSSSSLFSTRNQMKSAFSILIFCPNKNGILGTKKKCWVELPENSRKALNGNRAKLRWVICQFHLRRKNCQPTRVEHFLSPLSSSGHCRPKRKFFCLPFNYFSSIQLRVIMLGDALCVLQLGDHKKGCVSEGERKRELIRNILFREDSSFLGQRIFTYVTQAKNIFFSLIFPPSHSAPYTQRTRAKEKATNVPHSKWGDFHE